jgi:hypothetical protein
MPAKAYIVHCITIPEEVCTVSHRWIILLQTVMVLQKCYGVAYACMLTPGA